jgi:prepilin-type N-terminal cleavage/methylation domain-containing protein
MPDDIDERSRSAGAMPGFSLLEFLIVIGILAVLGSAGFIAVDRAREAAARATCNLGGIVVALQNYNSQHGELPPAVVRAADGQPLYNWRVLILPYLEEGELYQEFRLDEPWNSEHNIQLLSRMPGSFAAPWQRRVKVPPYHTLCRVLVGLGTAFDDRGGVSLPDDFPDGVANTLLFVEAGEPVPWTKPEEIAYDPTQRVQLQGLFRDGFRACTADGQYQFISHDIDQKLLHSLITRNGGEPLPATW